MINYEFFYIAFAIWLETFWRLIECFGDNTFTIEDNIKTSNINWIWEWVNKKKLDLIVSFLRD